MKYNCKQFLNFDDQGLENFMLAKTNRPHLQPCFLEFMLAKITTWQLNKHFWELKTVFHLQKWYTNNCYCGLRHRIKFKMYHLDHNWKISHCW